MLILRTIILTAIAAAIFAGAYALDLDRLALGSLFVGVLTLAVILDAIVMRSTKRRIAQLQLELAHGESLQQQVTIKSLALEAANKKLEAVIAQLEAAGTAPAEPLQPSAGERARHIQPLIDTLGGQLNEAVAPQPIGAETRPPDSAMTYQGWLDILKQEYLQDFIRRGGASVKFLVPQEATDLSTMREQLRNAAVEDGYMFVSIDAAATKVHMVDKLFNQVAKQIAWDDLAYEFLIHTLVAEKYLVPNDKQSFSLSHVADINGLDLGEMRAIINHGLRETLSEAHELTDDFRMAMLKLCQAQLDPMDFGARGADTVREWLTGDLKQISDLQSASIFEKIDRHSGGEMLSSLANWLHLVGRSGLVLYLDISQLLIEEKPGEFDETLYYSTESVVDGYEVLRQFIDRIDELSFCLITVLAPPSFLTDDQRGVRKYDALYLRIWDEMHGASRVNPLSPLVKLSSVSEPTGQIAMAAQR